MYGSTIVKSYQDLITAAEAALAHLDHPKFEAQSLLAFVLKCNRSRIIAFPEKTVTSEEASAFLDLVNARAEGVPFAYLTGEKEFYDLTLKVTRATLIPRGDTELLVETALSKMPENAPCRVIDMGTGSGAIALTLKKHRPQAIVWAVDQSQEALAVAMDNGKQLNLAVTFMHSHWFDQVPDEPFDLIVSNPPYIDGVDAHLDGDGVKFEPRSALVAENEGYADLDHLMMAALPRLKSQGYLMMEHGFEQGARLREKMTAAGYHNVVTLKDLGGNDRITLGQKQ
ncbi:peptide chain release factor N(5)-glutamine methyltransferase [Wohlfahrtiimonas chitiniclastica]|nr:peptide chain release factor N(5)-glutamine methyltransferase [Wohlfahrtiimonas chitiniclastica]MBS7818423.1 peptide chain release factor N(5)-glutamine methyltransferase [Wohlfahrtiimonas chitiniclastica]